MSDNTSVKLAKKKESNNSGTNQQQQQQQTGKTKHNVEEGRTSQEKYPESKKKHSIKGTESEQKNKQTTEITNSTTPTEPHQLSMDSSGNNPSGEMLANDLSAKGLNPDHWCKIFQEQGLRSKEQFQHIDRLTLNNLLSQTKFAWEKSAIYKLVDDGKKDDIFKQEARMEKVRSKLQDPQKNITDAFKMADDRRKTIFEENAWIKQFDLDNKVKERLKLETSGQQLVKRVPLTSHNVIRKIAGGQLLRGQFMYKDFKTSSSYRQKLIEVGEPIEIMSPGISETMEILEFNNKIQSDDFDSVLTHSGMSCAVSISKGISSIAGFEINAAGEKANVEEKRNTINKQEYYVKMNQILNVPIASFTLSNQNIDLSLSALKALTSLEHAYKFEKNTFEDKCKLFFHEFGSHYYTGLCHFGGRYVWSVTSISTSNINCEQNIEMAKWALHGSVGGGVSWISGEVKGSIEKKSETQKKNRTFSEKCKIFKKLEKFGGPQEVDDISLWKKGLSEYNNTWIIIDKDVSQKCYKGVWELIENQKQKFWDASGLGQQIQLVWEQLQKDYAEGMSWSKEQLYSCGSYENVTKENDTGLKRDPCFKEYENKMNDIIEKQIQEESDVSH